MIIIIVAYLTNSFFFVLCASSLFLISLPSSFTIKNTHSKYVYTYVYIYILERNLFQQLYIYIITWSNYWNEMFFPQQSMYKHTHTYIYMNSLYLFNWEKIMKWKKISHENSKTHYFLHYMKKENKSFNYFSDRKEWNFFSLHFPFPVYLYLYNCGIFFKWLIHLSCFICILNQHLEMKTLDKYSIKF